MRLRVLALAVLLLGGCRRADERKPEPQPSSEQAPSGALERPFLWSATKGGTVTYLFGTMHMGVDAERLPPVVWSKLASARSFAMEIDATDPALLGLGHRDSGSLADDLGPTYYAKLEALLGADRTASIARLKPVTAAIVLSSRELPPSGAPMDHVLLDRARTDRKRLVYLESAALQVELLERLLDARMLKLMLDDADRGARAQRELLASYLAGDGDRMFAAGASERTAALAHGYTAAEYDAMTDELLYRRNTAWIATIERMHAEGTAFVAVGALHLIGPNSVLDLLQKRGFDVARVR